MSWLCFSLFFTPFFLQCCFAYVMCVKDECILYWGSRANSTLHENVIISHITHLTSSEKFLIIRFSNKDVTMIISCIQPPNFWQLFRNKESVTFLYFFSLSHKTCQTHPTTPSWSSKSNHLLTPMSEAPVTWWHLQALFLILLSSFLPLLSYITCFSLYSAAFDCWSKHYQWPDQLNYGHLYSQ